MPLGKRQLLLQSQALSLSIKPIHQTLLMKASLLVFTGLLCLGLWQERTIPREPTAPTGRLRRPIALALVDDRRTLLVANQRSGTISRLDTRDLKLTREFPAGERLSDLVVTPDGRVVLVTDEARHMLIMLSRNDGDLRPVARVPVAKYPVSVSISADGTRCCVASLWSRRLSFVDLSKRRVVRTVSLPFAPRKQLSLPGGKLLVADAFAGQVAVVDVTSGRIDSVRELPFHNIRGLALDHTTSRMLISRQTLWGSEARPGLAVRNEIEAIPLKNVLDPRARLMLGSRRIELDEDGSGAAAGDPEGIAATADGRIVVALGGIGQVALVEPGQGYLRRLSAGRRSTAVVLSPRGDRAYVANTFSDSVTVLDLHSGKKADISLGPMPELSPSDRGEMLFYDATLSLENWMSCHSCHTDGHSNGQVIDTLGDGSYGTPKRVLSLGGVADSSPWAWNGSIKDLHAQLHKSVATTMHGPPLSARQANELAAFLHTLPPVPGVEPEATSPRDRAAINRGRSVFERNGCAHCHVPPLTYTTEGTFDVGLKDEDGNRRFNPPSLRGVSQRAGWFHDGRAATLDEVFTRFGHQLKNGLSERELSDLLRFLRSL